MKLLADADPALLLLLRAVPTDRWLRDMSDDWLLLLTAGDGGGAGGARASRAWCPRYSPPVTYISRLLADDLLVAPACGWRRWRAPSKLLELFMLRVLGGTRDSISTNFVPTNVFD